MEAKDMMYNEIAKNGFVSLEDLEMDDPYNKTALNTFNAYFNMMGISTNLISEIDRLPGPRNKK